MSTPALKQIVEGALLAAGGPLSVDRILSLFGDEERPRRGDLQAVLDALAEDYAERAIELVEVAGGWRVQVRQTCAPWVSRLYEERPARYSRALLETLALIAYRQPITRGEIEEIRGVAVSSNIVKTLIEREWVRVVGHREVPGRPALLATTRRFLDYFGLRTLDELPPLAEIRDPAFAVDVDLPGEAEPAADDDGLQLVVASGGGDVPADTEETMPDSGDSASAEHPGAEDEPKV
jgi:segregation and condensation protein B